MLAIQCIYTEEEFLKNILSKALPQIIAAVEEAGGEIYGPFPATVYKLKDNFRQIIYIKHDSHDIILQLRELFIREVKREDKRNLILLQFDLM